MTDIGTLLGRLDKRLTAIERSARLSSASLDDTALQVYDGDRSLRAVVGQQADGTTAANIVNGPQPPEPSAPIVASVLGGITVSWDGTFAGGAVMPLDWSRIEVHASPLSSYSPMAATLQSTIETPQGATVVVPTTGNLYVRLLARSTSGTASDPTAIVGPTGPSPVVASDILDGIVTTLKLANDAVTAAKIATGAVGTTEIADDAVTTPKIIAGAVQAGQIAALAVTTAKLDAEAVTAGKIGALAITTAKLDANAVTTAKLAAGSVDATALKADAITGKTITGGEIIGTVMHTATTGERLAINESSSNAFEVYNSANKQVGVIDGSGLRLFGDNFSEIGINPDDNFPNLYFTSDDGTKRAYMNVSGAAADDANISIYTGEFTGSSFSDMLWRTFSGRDFWAAERVRASNLAYIIGGRIAMSGAVAALQYVNSGDTTQNITLQLQAGFANVAGGRVEVVPPVSSLSMHYSNAPSGYTGNMMRLQLNSVDQFVVNNSGDATAAGDIAAGTTNWTSYTPTVAGAGTATWSVRDGWYKKIGKMVYVEVYIAFSAAGTGTGTVTVTLPSTPYRGSANRRQYLPTYCGGMVAGTNANTGGTCIGNINTSGSGAAIDQLRGPTDILQRGDNFSSTATITINGWYREA